MDNLLTLSQVRGMYKFLVAIRLSFLKMNQSICIISSLAAEGSDDAHKDQCRFYVGRKLED